MKLVRFEAAGRQSLGVLIEGDQVVVDLAAAAGSVGAERFQASMSTFLARGAQGLADAASVVGSAPAGAKHPLSSVRLLAPVGDPGKILCIGQNYRDHCDEQNQPYPERAI